ncbi:CoA-transferase [Salinactinospora qingdaonensis]|uniref:CoA transferase subunit A n=1 Tax=Salinactinospora qingdaonensis TaxID=702744 RepID=A0ABP7F506_9ACTN
MSLPHRVDLATAVERHTADGQTVYLGNFGAQLFCVGHELIRRRRGLHAVVPSGGILLDQLIGAGTLAAATFAHCWSPVGPAPAWNFRRAYQRDGVHGDTVTWHEMSLGAINAALTAAAWRVPFMPVPAVAATSYLTEGLGQGRYGRATSDFGEATVVAALRPDVAFLHADVADPWGNALVRAPLADSAVAAQAAGDVVLVVEESVSAARLRELGGGNLPGALVSTVVVEPGAVRPDGAAGRYDRDLAAYLHYAEAAASPESFARWLHREVLQ